MSRLFGLGSQPGSAAQSRGQSPASVRQASIRQASIRHASMRQNSARQISIRQGSGLGSGQEPGQGPDDVDEAEPEPEWDGAVALDQAINDLSDFLHDQSPERVMSPKALLGLTAEDSAARAVSHSRAHSPSHSPSHAATGKPWSALGYPTDAHADADADADAGVGVGAGASTDSWMHADNEPDVHIDALAMQGLRAKEWQATMLKYTDLFRYLQLPPVGDFAQTDEALPDAKLIEVRGCR